MKVYSFDWDDDDPIFDFKLMGFTSAHNKDYDFVFYLNKNCRFNFKRTKDQEILDKGISYKFSVYRFYDLKTKQEIELISNYSYPHTMREALGLFDETDMVKTLIPEYKSFNYFLKSDFLLDEEFYVTLPNLKNIQEYQEINIESIKINNLENLILPT
jgi:hypothetical protein